MRRHIQVATTLLLAVAGFAAGSACGPFPRDPQARWQPADQPSATGAAMQEPQPMGAWAPQFIAPLPSATGALP
jgi:hypothetical protein